MDKERLFRLGTSGGEGHFRVMAYYFRQWDGLDMVYHTHAETEIMYVLSGTCRIQVARAQQASSDTIRLKKGEFIVLDANVPHRLIVEKDSPCRMLNVEFGSSAKNGGLPSIDGWAAEDERLTALLAAPLPYIVLRDPDDVYHILKSLVLELDRQGTKQGIRVQLLLWQLLLRIAALWEQEERSGGGESETSLYVKQCMEFLQQNYDRDILVKDIAAAVNLHPGYLHRIFKAHTRRTIMEVLTSHRMEKAKMLLAQTQIPIGDIPEYVGINSRQYFHTLFKKHVNQTPVEYRNSVDLSQGSLPKK
ncbi:helix-turn-helix domain-containing protein [Paenibacillus sp. HJGM_3]|uniref:AraC family transcriptional regulator n=1 Tax=Paenibacillus sp. HJGM_3 TaxID=3379816 RepID=UPI003858ADC6